MKLTIKAKLLLVLCLLVMFGSGIYLYKQNNKKETVSTVSTNTKKSNTKQSTKSVSKKIICIDAGHQGKGNLEKEAIGPGSTTTKPKVTYGTSGIITKAKESEVTLQIAKKLKVKLQEAGYQVVMVRESQNVDISNKERAEIANQAHADAFLRLHCDSSDNASANGITTLAPANNNPYLSQSIIKKSQKLSQLLSASLVSTTKANNRGVSYVNNMSGINWCKVPVSIIEMGFMSNPTEDKNLSNNTYQDLLVKGYIQALNQFFK